MIKLMIIYINVIYMNWVENINIYVISIDKRYIDRYQDVVRSIYKRKNVILNKNSVT